MTHKLTTISMIALVSALMATSAFAGPRRGWDKEKRSGEPGERVMEQLDLTADQQAKMQALREDHREETKVLREKIRALHEQMRALWQVDEPDEEKILATHKKIHQLKGELQQLRIEMRIDMRAILTPDQKARAASLIEARHTNRNQKPNGRQNRRGPRW